LQLGQPEALAIADEVSGDGRSEKESVFCFLCENASHFSNCN